jgi:magnesium chelatase accessory protein
VSLRAPQWDREGRDWPNRNASRFVEAGGLRWHVQLLGAGPPLLLVHGTGAATHSWRDLAPRLAERFRVVAPDLPGHGFSQNPGPRGLSLPAVARSLGALLRTLEIEPALALGHSAGAAILARMCLDGRIAPGVLLSLNGAMLPLRGLAGQLFSPAAKLLAANPLIPRVFAWRAAQRDAVERLVASTGSRLDPEGVELYRRLIATPGHVGATLDMMAKWDLAPMVQGLPQLATPLVLVVGQSDTTVSPAEADRVRKLIPGAEILRLPGLGHLAHEEDPDGLNALVTRISRQYGIDQYAAELTTDRRSSLGSGIEAESMG